MVLRIPDPYNSPRAVTERTATAQGAASSDSRAVRNAQRIPLEDINGSYLPAPEDISPVTPAIHDAIQMAKSSVE